MKTEALEKGLAALQAVAAEDNPQARATELFQKSQDGTLTDEERDELLKSLGGGGGLAEEATSGFQNGESLQKSYDVSDTLREYVDATVAGMQVLSDRIEKSEANDNGFKAAVAHTLTAQGEILKSLSEAVSQMGAMPVRAPKSKGVQSQTIEKSFAGAPATDEMSKSEIEDTFEEMLSKGVTNAASEDVTVAATKYELSGAISRPMLAAIKEFRNNQQAA